MSNLAQVFEAVEILEKHNFSKDEAQKLVKSFESISASKEDLLRTEFNLKEEISNVKSELKEEISGVRSEIRSVRSELKEEITSVKKETLLLRQDLVKLENKLLWGLVSGVGVVIVAQIILKFF